jgi:hypothetical protein
MTTTILSAALNTAGITTSTFAYFDLMQFVEDALLDGQLKERVTSSLAWNIDMRCINAARNVFFDAYRQSLEDGVTEESTSIDRFNAYINGLNAANVAEKLVPVGHVITSPLALLCSLLALRVRWHERAAANSSRAYANKSLHILMLDEKVRTVDANTRGKMAIRANFVADGDKELQEVVLQKLIDKAQLTMQQQYEMRRKLTKPVIDILNYAQERVTTVGADAEFCELPVQVQRDLIEAASKAADRAVDDMGLSTRISVDDYAVAMRDAAAFKKSLAPVLKAERFNRANDE